MDGDVRVWIELAIHVAMGVGLAACAGLRAFLPLFVVGLAGRADWLPLSSSFEWLSTTPALVVFGVAVVVEILADKIPVVDNLLDTVQTIAKPVAGMAVTASVVTDWAPLYVSIAAIVVGGGLAGAVHLTKAKLRLLSTATTGGVANPALSVGEDLTSVAASFGAIFAPPLTALIVLVALGVVWFGFARLRQRLTGAGAPSTRGGA